jgi:thiamine-phosphate pyrophosphorylase
MDRLEKLLRFYFITDEGPSPFSPLEQVRVAIEAGATMVQYRNKNFRLETFEALEAIRALCHSRGVPLLINDQVLLAKAVGADGVHLGQADEAPRLARRVLGPEAIIGLSVSTLDELTRSTLEECDYIGTGPVFETHTKHDAKPVRHLEGLKEMVARSPLPVVAIGGITAGNAAECLRHGAAGVAVISAITRAPDPREAARAFARACGAGEPSYVTYVELLATYNPADIAIIKSILEDARITYHFRGDHLLLRPLGDAARLMVRTDEIEEARALLSDLELTYSETFYPKEQPDEADEDED